MKITLVLGMAESRDSDAEGMNTMSAEEAVVIARPSRSSMGHAE